MKKKQYVVGTGKNLFLEFILINKDRVIWNEVCQYQTLSQSFIRKFKDRVNWPAISANQKIDLSFVCEFKHRLDFKRVIRNRCITYDMIKKFMLYKKYRCSYQAEKAIKREHARIHIAKLINQDVASVVASFL